MNPDAQCALAEQHLAARLLYCAQQAGACIVLVTSAHRGEGKTHLLEVLARRAPRISAHTLATGPANHLYRELESGRLVADLCFMECPALLDDPEGDDPNPALWGAVDGAVIVALGHTTTRADLRTCQERLKALGVRPLGVVWNEHEHPPPDVLWQTILRRITQWWPGRRQRAALLRGKHS